MDTTPRAIHHLNCGTMCPHGARMLTGTGGLLESARIVCHCLLIEGADGLVLVDTGFGSEDVRRPRRLGRAFTAIVRPRLEAEETAASRVRALGFEPGDVRHIVTTHLDLDHAGGLSDFPDAEVHVHSAELAAARRPSLRERSRYISAQWAHGPRWVEHHAEGEQWLGFESVRMLPDAGEQILMIPLPGHTRGHTGVAVRDGDGWLLHCGDAYFHHGEVQTPASCPPGTSVFELLNQVDGATRRENRERLQELAARHGDEVELICSHDASTFDRYESGEPDAAISGS